MNRDGAWPFSRALVINENIRLRKKGGEALGNAKLLRAPPSILRAGRAPAIKNSTLSVKFADVPNDGRHRDALTARATNQRVVYIHKHMNWQNRCAGIHGDVRVAPTLSSSVTAPTRRAPKFWKPRRSAVRFAHRFL